MRGEIVEDDVDLLAFRLGADDLLKERDELRARMAADGLTHDLARANLKCRQQAESPVTVVFESVPLGPPWREGQHRVKAIQGLDLALFIDAEDGCVLRRIQVEADDVSGLGLEIGVIRSHVALYPVGFQSGVGPRSVDPHVWNAKMLREFARCPMGRPVGRLASSGLQDPSLAARREHRPPAAAMPREKARESRFLEPAAPTNYISAVTAEGFLDALVALPIRKQENRLGSASIVGPPASGSDLPVEHFSL